MKIYAIRHLTTAILAATLVATAVTKASSLTAPSDDELLLTDEEQYKANPMPTTLDPYGGPIEPSPPTVSPWIVDTYVAGLRKLRQSNLRGTKHNTVKFSLKVFSDEEDVADSDESGDSEASDDSEDCALIVESGLLDMKCLEKRCKGMTDPACVELLSSAMEAASSGSTETEVPTTDDPATDTPSTDTEN